MYSFASGAMHERATNDAEASFAPMLDRQHTRQDKTITIALELTGYRADDKTGDCIVVRDLHGSHQQFIYSASALDQGRLLQEFGLLVKRLRQQVLAASSATCGDPRSEQALEVEVRARAG